MFHRQRARLLVLHRPLPARPVHLRVLFRLHQVLRVRRLNAAEAAAGLWVAHRPDLLSAAFLRHQVRRLHRLNVAKAVADRLLSQHFRLGRLQRAGPRQFLRVPRRHRRRLPGAQNKRAGLVNQWQLRANPEERPLKVCRPRHLPANTKAEAHRPSLRHPAAALERALPKQPSPQANARGKGSADLPPRHPANPVA